MLNFFSDRAGARTQDPLLKREMLYQLSYQVVFKRALPAEAAELREAA